MFDKAQTVLKQVLPPKQFDKVYAVACNTFDVYQKINDHTFYIPAYLKAKVSNNTETINRIEVVQKVLGHTMVSRLGVLNTYDITYRALELEGCFVECGVARGGCSAVMAMIARNEGNNRKMWMFDSYEGLPPQTDKDGVQKSVRHKNRHGTDLATGYCLGTYEEVNDWLFRDLKLRQGNVKMVKGWFSETLPVYKNTIGEVAVLRLDGDWYESTKCCLENLYGNLVQGGYVIIDDYQLGGCKRAVDEFIGKTSPATKVIEDKNGRGYFRK